MSNMQQISRNITLQGSATMVRDYLSYAINNIFYQRGVGDLEEYEQVKMYKLILFVSKNPRIKDAVTSKLDAIQKFIEAKEVERVILILFNNKTNEALEKWHFTMNYETGRSGNACDVGTKDEKVIRNEISAVLRDVQGTSSYLPVLDDDIDLTFEIHVRQMPGIPIWEGWFSVPDPKIENEDTQELRSFSTSIHKVGTKVHFKNN